MTQINTNLNGPNPTIVDVAAETIGGKDLQRAKIALGDPGVDDGNVSKNNPMPMKHQSTGFVFSTVNSTVVQLASGATFPGAVEAVVDQPAYSILMTSDQPGTLTVFQYIDAAGTQLAGSIAYPITAGVGFARSGTMNGNYLKVTFQNTGGSATTTLRIDTAFGNILPATQANNFPIALMEILAGLVMPISASSLPLPAGAATQTTLAALLTALGSPLQAGGNVAVTSSALPSGAATQTTLAALLTALGSPLQAGGNVAVTSSALPSGAATQTTLAAILTALGSPLQAGGLVKLNAPAADMASGTLPTNSSAVQTSAVVGYAGAWVYVFGGSFSAATLNLSVSVDNGTTFVPVLAHRYDAASNLATNYTGLAGACCFWVPGPANSSTGVIYKAALSAGTITTAPTCVVAPAIQGPPPVSIANLTTAPTTVTRVSANASDGGSTTHHLISAATTNATSVKASGGQISLGVVSNNGASAVYFKVYNKASAPTVGTDTPVATILVPAGGTVVLTVNGWSRLATGIAYAITTGMAVADTTAVAATQVSVALIYT